MAAKFRFATDGFNTVVELDGKTIGTGVQKLEYQHEGGDHAMLKLELDLHDFRFMPDGTFDKRESVLMESTDQHTNEIS